MKVIRVTPDAITWKDNPAIPKGGQFAILQGDPTKPGDVVVQRVKFPANYKVPPHTHPYAENVTVISGRVGLGMGEKFDPKEGDMAAAGSFFLMTRLVLGSAPSTFGGFSGFGSAALAAAFAASSVTTRE